MKQTDPDVPTTPLTGDRRVVRGPQSPVQTTNPEGPQTGGPQTPVETAIPVSEALGFTVPKTSRPIEAVLDECHRDLNLLSAHIRHLTERVEHLTERIKRIQSERSESQDGEVPPASTNSATSAEGNSHE